MRLFGPLIDHPTDDVVPLLEVLLLCTFRSLSQWQGLVGRAGGERRTQSSRTFISSSVKVE